MSEPNYKNIQDVFLNAARKDKVIVNIFLTSGVRLQGKVVSFDNFSLMFRRDTHNVLVYKHAIATIIPQGVLDMHDGSRPQSGKTEAISEVADSDNDGDS
ncbi:MAG: RNA chaperone Hfq [Holosporales bacterium]|jgi:host factor-I protein|nr:RNA chaperone Hfq [Holosporales bacterium]